MLINNNDDKITGNVRPKLLKKTFYYYHGFDKKFEKVFLRC